MNYKEFFKPYCAAYNWYNNNIHKVYCNPHCPHFLGLSKKKMSPICEYDEIREYAKLHIENDP